MEFLEYLQEAPIGDFVRSSDYGYPIVLTLHSLGMAAVVGTVFTLCVRILGFAKGIPPASFKTLLTIAWWGFGVNAVSGVSLFMANGTNLITNWTFILKMTFIVLGGFTITILWRALMADPEVAGTEAAITAKARRYAVLSLVLWFGAVVWGRMIAYTLL